MPGDTLRPLSRSHWAPSDARINMCILRPLSKGLSSVPRKKKKDVKWSKSTKFKLMEGHPGTIYTDAGVAKNEKSEVLWLKVVFYIY